MKYEQIKMKKDKVSLDSFREEFYTLTTPVVEEQQQEDPEEELDTLEEINLTQWVFTVCACKVPTCPGGIWRNGEKSFRGSINDNPV